MESKKLEALKKITELMKENDISVINIRNFTEAREYHDYDLLCVCDGRKVRLPFNKGKNLNPIGLFPLSDSFSYIELNELPEALREHADVARLPEVSFCEDMCLDIKGINNHLRKLDKPILQGEYFAIGKFLQEHNWIVKFDEPCTELSSDYYDEEAKKAKIRYCGKFLPF